MTVGRASRFFWAKPLGWLARTISLVILGFLGHYERPNFRIADDTPRSSFSAFHNIASRE